MEEILELARRRGFLWPSFEIYGGASGFYDYGPLGAALKNKVEDVWRRFFVIGEGYLEISSPNIGVGEVFEASGHLAHFVDPVVKCEKCGQSFRADHLLKGKGVDTDGMSFEELDSGLKEKKVKCPNCGGRLSKINTFNLMFGTSIGAANREGYLRPETAQNIFILFNRLYDFHRKKLPFGVSQLGRAYRNEISPRQGLLRLREFSQAEVEVFVDPSEKNSHKRFSEAANIMLQLQSEDGNEFKISAGEAVEKRIIANQYLAYHLVRTYQYLREVGILDEKIRFRQHRITERAHYACDCWDAEVHTKRYGWIEVVGLADRTDYDLRSHIEKSGEELKAHIRYSKPRVSERKILEPDMKKLGPLYKNRAAKIEALIRSSGPENLKSDGSLDIELDGKKTNIKGDMFSLKNVKETVEGEKIIPHVIEPSFGIDRIIYCVLESAYIVEERNNEKRVVLRLNPEIAPYEASVFPLVSKGGLDERAYSIYKMLRERGFPVLYDTSGTIGRRYARADEIGVPIAVTVDFQTLEDETVTLRDRDTMEQKRVKIPKLPVALKEGF
jgi:glycyl-tRNA synthetase